MRNATVVLVAAGTLGDHQPMVVLGQALTARGHRVRFGCNEAMHDLCRDAGIEPFTVGPPLGPSEARASAATWDIRHRPQTPADQSAALAGWDARMTAQLIEGCRDADVVLTGYTWWYQAEVAAEVAGIPLVLAAIPPFVLNPSASPDQALVRSHLTAVRALRARHGLPDLPDEALQWPRARLTLQASSRHFSTPRGPHAANVVTTGFWFGAREFTPDERLVEFLRDGPAPLVLSFSSLPLVDPAEVLDVHVRAARALGMRMVVQRGWAGFDLPACDDILMVGQVPHDWLFARAAAVVTHGGIGTLAQAFRARCPVLVEPYGNDQFFNAWRVQELGVGAAVRPRDVTDRVVAYALREHVLTADTRTRVTAVADRMAEEPGVDDAVRHIESLLRQPRDRCGVSTSAQHV